jgi:cytoplasmic tRNA 2-thiolation protein 1
MKFIIQLLLKIYFGVERKLQLLLLEEKVWIFRRLVVSHFSHSDSTVLAELLTTLNMRHDYGLELFLLSVDEGISGYRDDSLEVVHHFAESF